MLEPHTSGCIHYHLLIPVNFDCHADTDLEAWRDKFTPMENVYFYSQDPTRCGCCTRESYLRNSMNTALRAEDDWWQAATKAHGFGRVQVAPIYGGAKAIRNYLIKDDWRRQPWRFKERKNIQFWRCSRNLAVGSTKFSWNSPRARQNRQQKAAWAKTYGCESLDDLRAVLGPRWGYRYMCEGVWSTKAKDGSEPPPPSTCPFPRPRRYNDPEYCWQRGPDVFAKAA